MAPRHAAWTARRSSWRARARSRRPRASRPAPADSSAPPEPPRTPPGAPVSRRASIASGCSCRQAPVSSGSHAHALTHRLLMRALVIGASGQVGATLLSTLRARGHDARGTFGHHTAPGLDPLDLTDHAAVARAVAAERPDWVLCPAGLSHVDYCEDHVDEALAANRDGPAAAARAAEAAGAGFVFYSSDYVFDGVG